MNFIEKSLASFAVMTKTPWQLWQRKIWKIKNDLNHYKAIYFWKASEETIILKQNQMMNKEVMAKKNFD